MIISANGNTRDAKIRILSLLLKEFFGTDIRVGTMKTTGCAAIYLSGRIIVLEDLTSGESKAS